MASEPASVPGPLREVVAEEAAPRRPRRAWLIIAIALSAIVLPALVLLCVSSIPAGRMDFADLRTGADRLPRSPDNRAMASSKTTRRKPAQLIGQD